MLWACPQCVGKCCAVLGVVGVVVPERHVVVVIVVVVEVLVEAFVVGVVAAVVVDLVAR